MSELDELRAEVDRLQREKDDFDKSVCSQCEADRKFEEQQADLRTRAERDEAENILLRARIAAAKTWSSESLGADAHVMLVRILNGEPTNLSMGSRDPR